ncbi:MAG: hypothetical protein Q9M15_01080, partial [Mariprofundaceae bacterium]|nr:hypothetical protein [Mariprofundaceae bacterium]
MSGIGLQQSILMGKNNNLSASLRAHKNAIDGWEHYCKTLEFKLDRERRSYASEMRETEHLTKMIKFGESALKRKDAALKRKEYIIEITDDILEKTKIARLNYEGVYHQTLRSQIETLDMLSVVKSKRVEYHKHVNTVAADVVASNTQAERSRAQVKVLSGFDKLCRDMLHHGFNLVRIQAKNAQDLKDSFMWVEDPEMHNIVENRKNKIINEVGPSLGSIRELGTVGSGPSRQGDVFNPNSPFNFGNTRARHSVETKAVDLQHIMLLSIAWGEYMSFTQSGEPIGYASQVHTLQQQKKAGMAALQDALTSAQPCLSTAQDKAVKLATLDSKLEHLHQAFQGLLQDAKPFIQARLKDLKAHVKFESEQDIHAKREFHVLPESLPPVHL